MKVIQRTYRRRQQTVEKRVVLVRVAEGRRLSQRAWRQQLQRRIVLGLLLV